MWQYLFETELGWTGLTIEDRAVSRVSFGWSELDQLVQRLEPTDVQERQIERLPRSTDCRYRFARECRQRIDEFMKSGADVLQEIPFIDPSRTPFQAAVVRACRAIRVGETRSYADVAREAGSPHACRAVGNQMARNPLPLLIPCHRVVGSAGGLGGYSAPTGLDLKRHLLALEAEAAQAVAS
ncbi:MAG: MGMT family protein [Pirellulaceae bacterium]|nr:MGMT family protein [Planctomycetales bacterium]